MDNLGFLLLSRSHNQTFNTLIFDMGILFVLVPIFKYFFEDIQQTYTNLVNKFFNSYKSKIEFTGWENLASGSFSYEYPLPMTAICHYLSNNNICTNLKYFNPSKNGAIYYDATPVPSYMKDKTISFLVNFGSNINIGNDLFLDYTYHSIQCSKDSKSDGNWKVNIVIKSNKKSIDEISKFIMKCIRDYDSYLEEKSKNKIYHFIFQGSSDKNGTKKLIFSSSILSDYSNPDKMSYENFDNLESEHNKMLKKDLSRLKDLEYYKKTGNKRKKGYLFYGPPGCGKTSSVIAMALEDRRHIIEISMSRLKTNEDLEHLFNLTEIHGIKFEKNQVILLFDEIDTGISALQKRKQEDKSSDEIKSQQKDEIIFKLLNKDDESSYSEVMKKDNDNINLGCILSRFDGVGSYNGIIIIATTNCKDKLSPALYRNGRLNPVFFNYISKEQIKGMIEKFYDKTLDESELDKLPDLEQKISHSTIKKLIDDFDDNLPGLLNSLNLMKDNEKKN